MCIRDRNSGVLVTDHHYTIGLRTKAGELLTLGQCKKYKFNPELVFSDPAIVEHHHEIKKPTSEETTVQKTARLLKQLKLTLRTEKQITAFVNQMVTREYVLNEISVNEEIADGWYYLKGIKKQTDIEVLKIAAKASGKDLILYRDRCYIENLETFISRKRYELKNSYVASLLKLKQGEIYCNRNDTNQRLDTNLTNLKSELLKVIRLDGEKLVSIDLSNSQFLFLARIIENTIENVLLENQSGLKNEPAKSFSGKINVKKDILKKEALTNTAIELSLIHI